MRRLGARLVFFTFLVTVGGTLALSQLYGLVVYGIKRRAVGAPPETEAAGGAMLLRSPCQKQERQPCRCRPSC